jgi:hypothetical protein
MTVARAQVTGAIEQQEQFRHDLLQLLRRNAREGYSRLLRRHYCYIAPAQGTYPF